MRNDGSALAAFFFFKFYLIICKRFVRENIKVNTLLHYLEVAE